MSTINSDDHRCPCCTNYIYINYECNNKHNICGHCFMKTPKCPICRNENITESNVSLKSDITRKDCKNKHIGCNLKLYHFDNDHEEDCPFNHLHCKFCNTDLIDANFDSIKTHYGSNCVNSFEILEYSDGNMTDEINGRKYNIKLKTKPSLINIDNHYFVMVIPKMSQKKVDFIIFSINEKYKLSNYKIKILSQSNVTLLESTINYKKLFNVSCNNIESTSDTFSFTIENMFILNRKKPTVAKMGDVTFCETYGMDGEPGSAGNWTYETFEKMQSKVSNMFADK